MRSTYTACEVVSAGETPAWGEFFSHTAPNLALEPTAYSFGFAYASGGGSPRAFGFLRSKGKFT
jgi:hypothetical protein